MFKILCTGNPNKGTIAHAICEVFPNAEFVYLSAGYDFTTTDGLYKFREKLKNYNVFINSSRIDIGVQIKLLKIASETPCIKNVFNIGTVLEHTYFNWLDPLVAEDKLKLRDMSLDLCCNQFRTTHLIVGGFKDESPNKELKMDPIHIANAIKWILHSDFHVPIIGIENDYWNNNWQSLKDKGRS